MTSQLGITDPGRQPHPDPCSDCGRTYLRGEHVQVRVPIAEPGATRLAWSGCVDCWLKHTTPPAGPTQADADEIIGYALDICMYGERAPGGEENWPTFMRMAEDYLRRRTCAGSHTPEDPKCPDCKPEHFPGDDAEWRLLVAKAPDRSFVNALVRRYSS